MTTISTRWNLVLQKRAPLFFSMGCLGVTTEVFFTAICDLWTADAQTGLSLKGVSYIWMFPIYGSIAFFFPPIMRKLHRWKAWQRALLYGIGIFAVEYAAGWALCAFTGHCPWEYKSGYQIHGFIRLDYYPLWVAFGAGVEKIVARIETWTTRTELTLSRLD